MRENAVLATADRRLALLAERQTLRTSNPPAAL